MIRAGDIQKGARAMSPTAPASLDRLGVPLELRERARMLWLITAVGGAWGWAICNFVWKVPGQDENPWYQAQLRQALAVGLVGWVGYPLCFLGWFAHVGLGVYGFKTIGAGQDYVAPVFGDLVLGKGTASGAGEPARPAQPAPRAENRPAGQVGGAGSALDPIEGVSLQTWAWAQAHIDIGHPLETILGRVQIDPQRWKRVTAQWLVRRATDPTGTVQAEYNRYRPSPPAQPAQPSQAAPQARAPATEPVPLERWVEVSVALEVAQVRGWDVGQLLGNFGLAVSDWNAVHAWWAQAFPARCQDPAFRARYEQLQQYYRQYYQGR
jgi:hypothetical protein